MWFYVKTKHCCSFIINYHTACQGRCKDEDQGQGHREFSPFWAAKAHISHSTQAAGPCHWAKWALQAHCHPSPADQVNDDSQCLCLHTTGKESCAWFTARTVLLAQSPLGTRCPSKKWVLSWYESLPLLWNLSGVREKTIRDRSSRSGFARIGGNTWHYMRVSVFLCDWWEENETRKWWKENIHLAFILCIGFLERGL